MAEEYSNIYTIPPNYTDSGKLMGGMLEGEHYIGLGIVAGIAVISFVVCILFRKRINVWLDRMYEKIRK